MKNKYNIMRNIGSWFVLIAMAFLPSSAAFADPTVFVASNQITGNNLLSFRIGGGGKIYSSRPVPTGGVGTGIGLGNQGGIAVTRSLLAVVNAGSNDLSLFDTKGHYGLKFLNKISSRGVRPVSVAFAGQKFLYVLNAGDSGNPSSVVGYRVNRKQGLVLMEESIRQLSDASIAPAELAFSPDNRWLAVTE